MGYLAYLLLVLLLGQSSAQDLQVTKTNTTFDFGLSLAALVYDGLDYVYIFGGYDSGTSAYYSNIQKYSIAADQIETVGHLPQALIGGKAAMGPEGDSIYYFGGQGSSLNYNFHVYKFNISSSTVRTVGYAPAETSFGGSVRVDQNTVLLFGGYSGSMLPRILEYNMNSTEGRVLLELPTCFNAGGVWDKRSESPYALIFCFGFGNGGIYPFDPVSANLGPPVLIDYLPDFHTGYAFDGDKYLYGVGGYFMQQDWDRSIAKINIKAMEWEMVPVTGLPGKYFSPTEAIFTNDNRIYVFGGRYHENGRDKSSKDIWYIDISADSTPTVQTSPPTTTYIPVTTTTAIPVTTATSVTTITPIPVTTPIPVPTTTAIPVPTTTAIPVTTTTAIPVTTSTAISVTTTTSIPVTTTTAIPVTTTAIPVTTTTAIPVTTTTAIPVTTTTAIPVTTTAAIPVTTTTVIPVPTTTLDPEIFDCRLTLDGFYPHPHHCDRYIGCLSGEMTEFQCPADHLFDPDTRTCNYPQFVNCDLGCTSRHDGVYPHSHDCRLFLACVGSVSFIYKCPGPLLFDQEGRRCNVPSIVECNNVEHY